MKILLSVVVTAIAVLAADPIKSLPTYVQENALSVWKRALLKSHGDRLNVPGKERSMFTGLFTKTGVQPVTMVITKELPDKIRLDQVSSNGKPILVPGSGTPTAGITSEDDKDLLEAFYLDTTEYFLLGGSQGAAYRLLGGRVRADDGKTINYQGPWYIVYQVAVPKSARGENGVRLKTFFFDTKDGLLSSVQYETTPQVQNTSVTIAYSNWKMIEGQAVPGLIRRLHGNTEIWRFQITSAEFSALAKDDFFKQR